MTYAKIAAMSALAVKPKLASRQKTSFDADCIIGVARLVADLHQGKEAANDEYASARLEGGLNTYAYVGGNPLRWVDPTGLDVLNPHNYPVSPQVMQSLQAFNNYIGSNQDVIITGGNRPATSNLGAGAGSQHARGTAVDIYVTRQTNLETANDALNSKLFNGVGWYEEGYRGPNGEGPHVHVDLRQGRTPENPAQWGYDRNGNYGPIPPYYPPGSPACQK